MINYIYQLITPHIISVKYQDIDISKDVIIRPKYMSICHADQRYYQGTRDLKTLNQKLPMALIHECCGQVIKDNTNTFNTGDYVSLIPNHPTRTLENIYENYDEMSKFSSSNEDGFMREFINLPPSRVVKINNNIPVEISSIIELISVAVHSVKRLDMFSHSTKKCFAIWGDGSVAYLVACILKEKYPNSKIIVVGKTLNKISQFSFVDETYITNNLPNNFSFDHAFECVGGEYSGYAIDEIINNIKPQGTISLLGVSEHKVAINTRLVLEKGITLLGCSRSGRADFIDAINFMSNQTVIDRLSGIIYETSNVNSIPDIHNAFSVDLTTPFKTIFKWNI